MIQVVGKNDSSSSSNARQLRRYHLVEVKYARIVETHNYYAVSSAFGCFPHPTSIVVFVLDLLIGFHLTKGGYNSNPQRPSTEAKCIVRMALQKFIDNNSTLSRYDHTLAKFTAFFPSGLTRFEWILRF